MANRGRPRKEQMSEPKIGQFEQMSEPKIGQFEQMSEPKIEQLKESVPSKPGLKVRVVSIGDYLAKAREIYGANDIDIWNNAVALLYSENKVIAILDKKGEARFVVEA